MNDLGITFSTWYRKDAGGSRSNIVEYTSCVGAHKKLLLCKLPSILAKYLYPDTAEIVYKVWNDFKIYYDFITDSNLESTSADEAFNKAKIWIELFCSLRQSRPGYTRTRVTPYMHIMCYHVPLRNSPVKVSKRTTMMQKGHCFRSHTSGIQLKIFYS